MLKRVLTGAVLIGLAVLVITAIPDLKRYLKIRNM
jgi:hypothetical protein